MGVLFEPADKEHPLSSELQPPAEAVIAAIENHRRARLKEHRHAGRYVRLLSIRENRESRQIRNF